MYPSGRTITPEPAPCCGNTPNIVWTWASVSMLTTDGRTRFTTLITSLSSGVRPVRGAGAVTGGAGAGAEAAGGLEGGGAAWGCGAGGRGAGWPEKTGWKY